MMNARTTVLHLMPGFQWGGSEGQAVLLFRSLHATGEYRLLLATLKASGPLLEGITALGVTEVPEYPLNRFYDLNAARQLRRFVEFLRQRRVDVLHTHDFYGNIFGMTAGFLAGVPARVAARRESTWRSAPKRFLQRCSYRLAHTVVANCEHLRRQLLDEGVPEEKTTTIFNGVDIDGRVCRLSQSRNEILGSFGLPEDGGPIVTIVANFILALKDQPTLLRAAKRVLAVVPEARFVFAGEGPLIPDARAMAAELDISDRVRFVGRCGRVADLLAVSDVGALSSTSEGLPNVLLEYMAAGLPAVSTDVGGASEIVVEGETGWLVRPHDDAAMADRLCQLLQHPQAARCMGEKGRDRVRREFSPQAQLRKTQELYGRLLSRCEGAGTATPSQPRAE